MSDVLKSEQFDDIYFSVQDGLAETHHVFLQGNDLPRAWGDKSAFIVGETGFGTGLNFLATWKVFEETSLPHQRLEFVSVEKYPLSKTEISKALQNWQNDLLPYLKRYLDLYPIRVAGVHKIHLTDRVSLTLWIGDINECLPEWHGFTVDSWFLDGFTPAKNPQMWTQTVFENMARLSHPETSYATFTAAGDVRRGLESAGFSVEKVKGFGRKRDMIKGRYLSEHIIESRRPPVNPVIIGGGLAGTALARSFMRRGIQPIIIEAGDHLACAASGGEWGMVDPKLTAIRTSHSDYYTAAYANALRVLGDMARNSADISFAQHGGLHLQSDADKQRRFEGYRDNLGWHDDHLRIIDTEKVGEKSGIESPLPAIYYADAAAVSPRKLCAAMASGADIRLNSPVESIDKTATGWRVAITGSAQNIETDALFLANGFAAQELIDPDLGLLSVRGQVSYIKPNSKTRHLKLNFCFGGYLTPLTDDGCHILGSSFLPWESDAQVTDEDHKTNRARFNEAMGNDIIGDTDIVGGWASLRTSNKDRFPYIGKLDDRLYMSTAHGSHGIISSLMAADILLSQIYGEVVPATPAVLAALDPLRFHKP